MIRATDIAQRLLQPAIAPGDWVADATVGNGHDTLFLADCVGPSGRVFGFDIQETAVVATAAKVSLLPHVTLFQCGHEHLADRLGATAQNRLAAVMFNLGYLPGGSKDIVTRSDTTLMGLAQAAQLLAVGGLITVVLYPGHDGGAAEAKAVKDYAQRLPAAFAASHVVRANSVLPAPELMVIERRV
jgi:predicted methyltransferase